MELVWLHLLLFLLPQSIIKLLWRKFPPKAELNMFHMRREKLYMSKLKEFNKFPFKELLLSMRKLLDKKEFQFKESFRITMLLNIKSNTFQMLSKKLLLNMLLKSMSLKEFNMFLSKLKLFIIQKLSLLPQELTYKEVLFQLEVSFLEASYQEELLVVLSQED